MNSRDSATWAWTMVLDQDKGPLLLELNARPGLAIQIANAAGLMPRVKLVEAHSQALPTVEARIAFAREHFPANLTVSQ